MLPFVSMISVLSKVTRGITKDFLTFPRGYRNGKIQETIKIRENIGTI